MILSCGLANVRLTSVINDVALKDGRHSTRVAPDIWVILTGAVIPDAVEKTLVHFA